MKLKFIKALLEACETPDEIDEVFNMAEYDLFSDRCSLLEEKGVKYFDLPEDTKARYEILKQMYVNDNARFYRKVKKAKAVLNEVL